MRNNENPRIIMVFILVFWVIFCAVMFVNSDDLTLRGKFVFAVMSLWIFIRMARYRGRYRPKIVYVVKIMWLPMLALFAYLALIGEL